jgi:hypothetical protein
MRELQLRNPDGAEDGSVADRDVTQSAGDRFEKRRLIGWHQRLGCVGWPSVSAIGFILVLRSHATR